MSDNFQDQKPTPNTCLPEKELDIEPLLLKYIDTNDRHRIGVILDEFIKGFRFLQHHAENSVSFFGSARTPSDHPDYQQARELAGKITQEGYSIITGGGPGIMEAANRGAMDAGGKSLGLTIKLPNEQATNDYVQDHVSFYYFFVRKVMLAFSAKAYIFFPGGFGTMDELFELLTLIQTNKVEPVPIILADHEHWRQFDKYLQDNLLANQAIDREDMNIYTMTNDHEEILRIINDSSHRKGDPEK